MNRFRYLADPLFLSGCGCYALNRWLLKPHSHNAFVRGYLNDLFLIPCALPPILLIHRWLKLRREDEMPTVGEIAFHLIIWSILFEVIGPKFIQSTADPLDILAYATGAVLAIIWWRGADLRKRHGRGSIT